MYVYLLSFLIFKAFDISVTHAGFKTARQIYFGGFISWIKLVRNHSLL